jgi:hypothetical protein
MFLTDPAIRALVRPGMGLHLVERTQYDFDFWNGRLLIWALPEPGASYCIGVDVAEGLGKDRSVVEVVRIGDRKRPDEQVAEWASDYHDEMELSPIVNTIGHFFLDDDKTEALCNIELNGPGKSTLQDLRFRLDYGNLFIFKRYDSRNSALTQWLGFVTTPSTRKQLVGRGMHAIKRGDLIVHSEFLLDEMADFQRDHFMAKAQAVAGTHDDRVMALLLANWGAHDDELMAGEDIAEERRVLAHAQAKWHTTEVASGASEDGQVVDPAAPPKPDWFNLPVSVDSMKDGWDKFFEE